MIHFCCSINGTIPNLFVAVCIKKIEKNNDLVSFLRPSTRGIRNHHFIAYCHREFRSCHIINPLTIEQLELYSGFEFCFLKKGKKLSLTELPSFTKPIIFLIEETRTSRKRLETLTKIFRKQFLNKHFFFRKYHYAQLKAKDLRQVLRNQKDTIIGIKNISVALILMGISFDKKRIFSLQNLDLIQKENCFRLNIYQYDDDGNMFPYYSPRNKDTSFRTVNILIKEEPNFNQEIVNFSLITNEKIIPKVYVCSKMVKCNYSTSRYDNYLRHIQKCPEISTQKIYTTQAMYGILAGPLDHLIKSGYLPEEAKEFRKSIFISFDIEAIESKTGILRKKTLEVAEHKVLSIAIGANTGFEWAQHRKDSSPDAAFMLVENFLDKISTLQDVYDAQFPDFFHDAIETLETDLKCETLSRVKKRYLNMLKNYLGKYLKMDIYSYNGGRYDLNVLAPYLLPALNRRFSDVRLLKKNSSYFSIETESWCFKDAINFTTPQKLSSYLSQNGIKEEKSIFPYTAFTSIEEMLETKTFPSHEKFFSELSNANVSFEDYENAKKEFNRRLSLADDHKEKMRNFADWLLFYNLMDVVPLSKAINQSFSNFFDIFDYDPSWCLSLPKFAQEGFKFISTY